MCNTIRALQSAGHAHQPCRYHGPPIAFKNLTPNHNVNGSGFILERDKNNPLGGARPLAQNYKSGNAYACMRRRLVQMGSAAG